MVSHERNTFMLLPTLHLGFRFIMAEISVTRQDKMRPIFIMIKTERLMCRITRANLSQVFSREVSCPPLLLFNGTHFPLLFLNLRWGLIIWGEPLEIKQAAQLAQAELFSS